MRRIAIALLFFSLFPLTRVNALTLHVPSQYPTIWEAINDTFPGDTVLVADGTYEALPPDQSLFILFYNKSNITLISENGKDFTILSSPVGGDVTMIRFTQSHNCSMIGFSLINVKRRAFEAYQSTAIKIYNCQIAGADEEAIVISECSDIVIANNIIEQNGIGIASNIAYDVEIAHNTICNNRDGININGGTAAITSNDVRMNQYNGIFIRGGWESSINVESNIVCGNGKHGIQFYYDSNNPATIYSNTIAANGLYGIIVHGGSPDIHANIVAANTGAGIGADVLGNPYMTCNDVWGNAHFANGNYVGYISDQTGFNGNISADPFFCNASVGDYSLAANSPALLATCGRMGAITTPGCSNQTPVEQVTWGAIKALYR